MSSFLSESRHILREKGYKLTSTRLAVLKIMAKNSKKHLTSQQIYDLVKKEHSHIGMATVYRTLHLLQEMGLIYSNIFTDGVLRYELADISDRHKHHHLVCEVCGEISEVQEDLLESIEKSIHKNSGFKVTDHSLKFYGICKKCQNGQK